jgi:hypothetical protein
MEDLVKAFFERDLSPIEEQSLDSLLESSPQDAFRLLETAKMLYSQTHLPSPENQADKFVFSTNLFRTKLFWSLLASCAIAGALWWEFSKIQPPAAARPVVSTFADPTFRVLKPAIELKPKNIEPKSLLSSPTKPVQPQIYNPEKKYDGLSLIVNQTAPGLMTARVLDATGNEVRLLFANLLSAGQWTFSWDGREQDGRLAPSGTYEVEIQSGNTVLRKGIKIIRAVNQ